MADWKGPYPQVDYGQGSGAWIPASRAPVYQAMERARLESYFARMFAADILFGREESGGHTWGYETVDQGHYDNNGDWIPNPVPVLTRFSCKWLYNENTLNASKTWVALLFGPPSVQSGSAWFKAGAFWSGSDWGFIAEDSPSGDTLRMLQEGHWAFSATGCNGVTVCVPYAEDSKPLKEGRGRIECGNSKKTPQGRYYR